VDLLLAEEFDVNPAFADHIKSLTKFAGEPVTVAEFWVSKSNNLGESDLVVAYRRSDGSRFALLIEDNLAKHLLYARFRDDEGFPKQHLFPQIQRLARRWLDEGYLVTKDVPIGAILYQDQLARAAEKIDIALTRGSEGRLLAVLDPYNPRGSTRFVNFITSKPVWKTGAQPPKCHISHVVLDGSWEEALALTLENHPRVISYAKNQAMGFDVPYLDAGVMRRYVPDFLVRLDDGGDEPLNLVLEVKGMRDESDKAKAQTTRYLWVPGVNALGGFGRWDFQEFRDWAMMEENFGALVDRLLKKENA
jgi:type III restriction enzyme